MGQGGEGGLPEVNGWSTGPALIEPVSEQTVVELNGLVYTAGGYPHDRIPVNLVWIFDPRTGRWSVGPPLPIALHHAMGAAVNGKLYVIGGEMNGAGTGLPAVFIDTVWELDPAVGEWTAKASMPTARSGGGAAAVNGRIYVAGGRPPRGGDFAVYDPAADGWTVLPDLPTGRNHLAVAAIDGLVYVAGGRFGGGFNSERTDVLEVFDPRTGTWSTRAPLPAPQGGVASVEANGCLFVIGGEGNYSDPRGLSDNTEMYNPRTNSWTTLAPMPTPTHGLIGGAFIDGVIYLPGGAVTQGTASASTIHWKYRPEVRCR